MKDYICLLCNCTYIKSPYVSSIYVFFPNFVTETCLVLSLHTISLKNEINLLKVNAKIYYRRYKQKCAVCGRQKSSIQLFFARKSSPEGKAEGLFLSLHFY